MNISERKAKITELLLKYGEVRVDYLSKELSTSEVTIRKDLADLEAQGFLIRRFGGAVLPSHSASPSPATPKITRLKQAIAQQAAGLVTPGSRLVIDSGSTLSALVPFLRKIPQLVVMTNSLETAETLIDMPNDITVLMPGGTWDRRSEAFQGHLAEKMLAFYDFDWAFIGADGLDLARGTTTFNEFTGLSRAMARAAKTVVVLAESVKVGRKMPNLELTWDQVDHLITDDRLGGEDQQQLMAAGVRVTRAKPATNN